MIYSIKIKNFKSIGKEEQVLDNLGSVNVFIGENNSGKTAGLEILWIFGEILLENLETTGRINSIGSLIDQESSFPAGDILDKIKTISSNIDKMTDFVHQNEGNIELEIVFNANDSFREHVKDLSTSKRNLQEERVLEEKLIRDVKDIDLLKLRFILDFNRHVFRIIQVGWGNINLVCIENNTLKYVSLDDYLADSHFLIENANLNRNNRFFNNVIVPQIREFLSYLRRTYYIHSKRKIDEIIKVDDGRQGIKGSNLKKIMFDLFHDGDQRRREKYFKILEVFKKIAGKQIRRDPYKDSRKVDLVFEEGNISVNIDNSGYGYNHLLNLVYNIIISDANTILIDEPEISLHPQAQLRFIEFIKEVANKEKKQFFISTHSPYFISLEAIDKVFKFTKSDTITHVTRINNEKTVQAIKDKKEGIFNFRHRELFFMNKVIFVEGSEDLVALPQYFTESLSISRECLYQLGGINDEKIALFSSFCNDLGIKYAFILDFDYLRKDTNKKRFIQALKKIEEKPKSTNRLLTLLDKNGLKGKNKEMVKDIWLKDWASYWNKKTLQNLLKKYKANGIFIMPFYDVKILKETTATDFAFEANKIISEVNEYLL
ncbi:MAG: AAA family ATPase [Candidatus Omnitrophica bacterium]|nr:AAA family ATPase [Candidatus Omnitrophota bacterium]